MRSPVLFWGLFALIGAGFVIAPHWVYLIPLGFLGSFLTKKFPSLFFLFLGASLAWIKIPSVPSSELEGEGTFVLQSISPTQSFFKRSYLLKGTLKNFKTDDKILQKIQCLIFVDQVPLSGSSWRIKGILQKKDRFVFKPLKHCPWTVLDHSFSFARWRFHNKEVLRNYFKTKIKEKKVAHFFSSIVTGDVDDKLLSMEFRKLGLSHILAISGFHFALLAGIFGWILKNLFSQKVALFTLFGLLTTYFLFLGTTPSILRAFIMISLYLFSFLLKRKTDVLNLFGVALLGEVLIDPLVVIHIGFQLSFLATFGILVFYPNFDRLFSYLLPKRNFFEKEELSLVEKQGARLSSLIRKGFSLNVSVYATTLPVLLYTFHMFPLISIPYNLLLPPLLTLSLVLLPFSFVFSPLRFLNIKYTDWVLGLISTPPEILNIKFFIHSFPFPLLICILTYIGGIGLTKRGQTS